MYDSYIWKSLLQTNDGDLNIKDPNFIVSLDNYSLKNELEKTIRSFFEKPTHSKKHAICQFPARYYWIKSKLDLDDDIFPVVSCPEFEEYKNKTSFNKISLIFVSEDVSQPSSMMGHVFLKISGQDNNSNYVSHAVSFYTVIDTANIPVLIIKSTMTGMKGFFSLLPYEEQIYKYLEVQNRNVWEYELELPENVKKLIYLNLWELKDVKFKYLFTGYNCATVIYNILSLCSENFNRKNNYLWITPKTVIKAAHNNNLIDSTKMIPSNKWKIRMLFESLENENIDNVYSLFENKDTTIILSENFPSRVLQCELIETYYEYMLKNEKTIDRYNYIDNVLNNNCASEEFKKNYYSIDLSQYKSPLKTYPETQIGVGYKNLGSYGYGKIYFLPASHTISDDNREYLSESSLKLGETSILIRSNDIKLEEFQLYSMKNLVPFNRLVNGISSSVNVGVEQQYDKQLLNHLAISINAGGGLAKKILTDMNIYFLANVGGGYGKSRYYFYGYPEIGVSIYEIMNMKTNITYKYILNQVEQKNYYHRYDISQSFYLSSKYKFNVTYEGIIRKSQKINNFEILFYMYF